jgi:hypothetical protein
MLARGNNAGNAADRTGELLETAGNLRPSNY